MNPGANFANDPFLSDYDNQTIKNFCSWLLNFKAFELSLCGDEMINISVDLKKPSDLFLNMEKCYFPIKAKEFLRRILFRVLESMPVENYSWSGGYGRAAELREMKKFFGTKNKIEI